jgi:hypothetical protein
MNPPKAYEKVNSAGKDEKELRRAAKEILVESFDNDGVTIEYQTSNQDLNVGEPTVSPTNFAIDGVKVQNVGPGEELQMSVRASYYDTAAFTNDITSPAPSLGPEVGVKEETITVGVNLTITVGTAIMEGEAMVIFTEGYN